MPRIDRPTTGPTPATSTTSNSTTNTASTTTPAGTPGTPGWGPRTTPRVSRPHQPVTAPTGPTTGPTAPAGPTPSTNVVPIHFTGPATFLGAKLTPEALAGSFRGVSAEKFGSTDVQLPQPDGTTKTYNVRDMHYDLGGGKVGMNLIPVKDNDPAANKQMDAFIRQQSGLGPNEPIFALIAYVHPEMHEGSLKDLGGEMLKTEMSNTHLGAYVGEGKTTNSPESYHQKTWNVKGYPANVQLVSLKDTPQAELNRNMLDADGVLNKGVQFPPDYKNDPMRAVDLNTNLMFYRDWIKDEPYLKDDSSWHTYCAEHKTMVTNIGLNVPHNEDSFKEIFGAAEGPALFAKYKEKFEAANGRPFTAADETHFEPLWKKEGLTPEQIRPPTKAEYDKYQAARFDGTLSNGSYTGYKPLPAGKAMAWKPETTADLVKNFMETYASFKDVGGYASSAALMGFKDTVKDRMGITDQQYMETALPVVNKIMVAEAMARAPGDAAGLQAWSQKAAAGLYVAFGGKPEDFAAGGTVNPQLMGLAKQCLQGVPSAAPQIAQMAALPADKRNDAAYGWMRGSIETDMERARSVMVSDASKTEFYSPPAVTNRVANGIVDKDPNVTIRVIATAVDASEVQ